MLNNTPPQKKQKTPPIYKIFRCLFLCIHTLMKLFLWLCSFIIKFNKQKNALKSLCLMGQLAEKNGKCKNALLHFSFNTFAAKQKSPLCSCIV